MIAMKNYLLDPDSEIIDASGNTQLHLLAQNDEDVLSLPDLHNCPHRLFMLNNEGMTPLDICIQDEILDNLDFTQEIDGILSHREPEINVKKV